MKENKFTGNDFLLVILNIFFSIVAVMLFFIDDISNWNKESNKKKEEDFIIAIYKKYEEIKIQKIKLYSLPLKSPCNEDVPNQCRNGLVCRTVTFILPYICTYKKSSRKESQTCHHSDQCVGNLICGSNQQNFFTKRCIDLLKKSYKGKYYDICKIDKHCSKGMACIGQFVQYERFCTWKPYTRKLGQSCLRYGQCLKSLKCVNEFCIKK